MPEHLLCPFLHFSAFGCNLLVSNTAIYEADYAVNSKNFTNSAGRGDNVPVQTPGVQAHFSGAECRLPAAAEVASLQTPSSSPFTETPAGEELQLLPQRRGGDRLLSARQGPHCVPEPAMLWPH